MILWARLWLGIGQWAGGGGAEGEGLPQLRTLRPPSLGLRVKFQPPHVTRHGRCLRPALLSSVPRTAPLPGPRSPDAELSRGAGAGQTPRPWAHGRITSPGCEVTSTPGIVESPRLARAAGTLAPLRVGAAGGDREPGGCRREPGVSCASQPAAAAPGAGEPRLCVCLRPCLRAQPGGVRSRLAVRVPGAGLGQSRRWELQLSLSFLFRNEQNKKDFQTCLGRDRMPNGRAPSFFPACYLSCSVVWGEAARGPTPTGGSRPGGRGPLSWCAPWREGSPRHRVGGPGPSGKGRLGLV